MSIHTQPEINEEVFKSALAFVDSLNLTQKTVSDVPYTALVGFVFVWMAYNSEYNKNYKNIREKDRFINYFSIVGRRYYSKNRHEIYVSFVKSLAEGRRSIKNLWNMKDIKTPKNEDDLSIEKVSEIIYVIRCNYFHGSKEVLNYDDQKLLKWAYRILREVAAEA